MSIYNINQYTQEIVLVGPASKRGHYYNEMTIKPNITGPASKQRFRRSPDTVTEGPTSGPASKTIISMTIVTVKVTKGFFNQ